MAIAQHQRTLLLAVDYEACVHLHHLRPEAAMAHGLLPWYHVTWSTGVRWCRCYRGADPADPGTCSFSSGPERNETSCPRTYVLRT